MTPIVVKKGDKPKGYTVVYIGRPSLFGNPFPMHGEHTRIAAITQHHTWLNIQRRYNTPEWQAVVELAERVRKGEKIALECYCAPKKCHGDTIVSAIEWINNQEDDQEEE